MKPKLTIAVKRGLKDVRNLAESDLDADLAEDCPQFTGKRLSDIRSALRWISAQFDHAPINEVGTERKE